MIKKHLLALIDVRLIVFLVVIVALCGILTLFFSGKVKEFAKYKKEFYVYVFSFALIYALIAFLGYNKLFNELSDEFMFYQIASLVFGTLHVWLYRWHFREFQDKSIRIELLFALLVILYSSVLFTIIYTALNGLDLIYVMCMHFIAFVVPTGIYMTFEYMMHIPSREYVTWKIPEGEDPFPEIETLEMKHLLLITLLIQRHENSKGFVTIRSKGPVRIDFGPLFYNTITGYNTQYPDKKIDLDRNGENYNWVFFLQTKWYESTKYVDANFTLGMNGITENSVIICKRQKQELIKIDKVNKTEEEDFIYEPQIKKATEKDVK